MKKTIAVDKPLPPLPGQLLNIGFVSRKCSIIFSNDVTHLSGNELTRVPNVV